MRLSKLINAIYGCMYVYDYSHVMKSGWKVFVYIVSCTLECHPEAMYVPTNLIKGCSRWEVTSCPNVCPASAVLSSSFSWQCLVEERHLVRDT